MEVDRDRTRSLGTGDANGEEEALSMNNDFEAQGHENDWLGEDRLILTAWGKWKRYGISPDGNRS